MIAENETGAGTAEIAKGDRNEIEEFAKNKVNLYNRVMAQLGLPYLFEYAIQVDDGTRQRANELDHLNMKYIQKNKGHYRNDLWNLLNADLLFLCISND